MKKMLTQKKILRKLIYSLFALLILAPVTGELWRANIFGIELLPSDLIILTLFPTWCIDKLKNDPVLRVGKVGRAILLFLFIMVSTYLVNLLRFDISEMLVGFTLMGRFGMYVIIAGMAFDMLDRDVTGSSKRMGDFKKLLLSSMIISMVLIVILGFLQLKFFPSFLELGLHLDGWDPHIGRLLSTWFDPNFIGGFLGFVLSVTIALALYYWKINNKKLTLLLGLISFFGLIALYLTFSRSGYLTLMAGLGILSFFKSRKLLVALVILGLLSFSFSSRMQERTLEAVDSAKGLIGLDSQKPLDPTARLRVYSWQFAGSIIRDYPYLGAGYGRYAFEINQRGHGLLSDHSSGGSDSSVLTIWAQTGIVGVLSYLFIGFMATVVAIKRIWKKNDLDSYLQLGLLSGFAGMMIHSLFVNSLLYALMMVYLWVGLALMDESVEANR